MFLILSLLAALPSIEDTIFPQEYLVAGPFLTGVREGTGRILPDDTSFVPKEGDSLFSVQTTGGWTKWQRVKVDSTGRLATSYPDVDWEFLQDFYGFSALYNSGYAYCEIRVPRKCRALALPMGCSFSINGRSCMGDVYSSGIVEMPVVLDKGRNRIWLYLGGAGDDRVSFKLVPADDDCRLVLKDATLPDLVYRGENSTLVGALPVSNTTEDWLEEAKLIVGGGAFKLDTLSIPPVAPLNFYKVPFEFELKETLPDSIPGDSVMLPVSLIWEGGRTDASLKLRCRKPDESRKETFISQIDSSVQYYGLLPPKNYDPEKKYPLIFSLHGAGVEAAGQVDAYTQKDWAFVACPTNRRPFGFDWQDWGRLDALEVLGTVKERYPINPDRVQLTGHSMGGHGTWHIGLTHPDLFASASPEAGWTNHELYAPWTWQKSAIFAEPWQLEVRNQALRGDNQLARLENASNLPLFILQGGADDNVPAFQARLYAARLQQLGFDYRYVEVPGKPHWWADSGVACVNWPAIMTFMQEQVKPSYPEHVYYRTADLTQENGAYWLRIHAARDRLKDAVIEGSYKGRTFEITTDNVSRFALLLPHKTRNASLTIKIDDDKIILPVSPVDSVSFEFSDGHWFQATSGDYPLPHPPIKGAYYEPFILVYGTQGNALETEKLFAMARSEAQAWWYRANGTARILPDTLVDAGITDRYNLILLGNAYQNAVTARLEEYLPIWIEDGRFVFGDEVLPPEALAALFVYPNPSNSEKKVVVREGIGSDGLKLSGYFSTLYSGAGLPDYIIWGKDVTDKGWGGVVKAGFFTAEWTF